MEVPVKNSIYREFLVEKLVERPYDVIIENLIVNEKVVDIEEEALSRIDLNDV